MSLEQESRQNIYEEKTAEKQIINEFENPGPDASVPDDAGGINIDFGFLLKKTGAGSIEEYLDHPLNYKKSRGIAQVLRGFTGLAGDLDLAVIDIAIGGFEVIRERRAGHEQFNEQG